MGVPQDVIRMFLTICGLKQRFLRILMTFSYNVPFDTLLLKLVSAIFIFFPPNDSPYIIMKSTFLKSSFRPQHIQSFVFPCSLLFFSVGHCFRGWSKINVKVYDVIICLNKNLMTNFVSYLEKEKNTTLKVCQLIEYQIRNILMEKSCRTSAPNASPRPLFNFGI